MKTKVEVMFNFTLGTGSPGESPNKWIDNKRVTPVKSKYTVGQISAEDELNFASKNCTSLIDIS